MHFRVHEKDKYREPKISLAPSSQRRFHQRPFIESCVETGTRAMNCSGFLNATCSRDFIIPRCGLSFPGEKVSLLKILALEQECVRSLYRKQLSVSSCVRPQGPGLHFIKLGAGSGGGSKYRKKCSLSSAVFSPAQNNTSRLHDSAAETAEHAKGPEKRDSARPTALHKRGWERQVPGSCY